MLAEIERFVNWVRRRNPEAHIWRDYRCDLRFFLEVVGDRPPQEVNFRDVDRFVAWQSEKGFKPATINHRRDALLDRAVFYLLWQGGLRLGEVEELRLEDLDFPGKRLSVRNGKGLKDRTVYLTGTVISALNDYLALRGEGSGDNVFLYRNAPLKKDLISSRMRDCGRRVGVHVYPHRLRHTCATQLLNSGCRVTSIQRFLGHKKLNTTMIYARAHDQTVAEDYFTAMQRVEQRLEIIPEEQHQTSTEDVKVQPRLSYSQGQIQVYRLIKQLELPGLRFEERLDIASQLRAMLGTRHEQALSTGHPALIPQLAEIHP